MTLFMWRGLFAPVSFIVFGYSLRTWMASSIAGGGAAHLDGVVHSWWLYHAVPAIVLSEQVSAFASFCPICQRFVF